MGANRIASRQDGTLSYVLTDNLGSSTVMLDTTGAITSEERYYPFGQLRDGAWSLGTNFGYTGQRRLEGTGLLDYDARMYLPAIGRFISADTIVPDYKNPQSLNRFAYTLNNPIKYNDPTGHCVDPTGFSLIVCALAAISAAIVTPAAITTGADYYAQTEIARHSEYKGAGCVDAKCEGGFWGYMRDRGVAVFGVSAAVNTVTAGAGKYVVPGLAAKVAPSVGLPTKAGTQLVAVGLDATIAGAGNTTKGVGISLFTGDKYRLENALFDYGVGFVFGGSQSWFSRGAQTTYNGPIYTRVLERADNGAPIFVESWYIPPRVQEIFLNSAAQTTSIINNTQPAWDGNSVSPNTLKSNSKPPDATPVRRNSIFGRHTRYE